MTTATLTLTDFLLARIAEDEDAAPYVFAEHYTPHRIEAECKAKRRIIRVAEANVCDTAPAARSRRDLGNAILSALAAIYADHADYRPEWRP